MPVTAISSACLIGLGCFHVCAEDAGSKFLIVLTDYFEQV
jgi:hypothetical protein